MRDGESGHESPADPEPLEVQPSMPTAVEKVAAALAKRQAGAAATAPAKTKPAPEPVEDDEVADEDEAPVRKPATKMTPAERRAAREARVKAAAKAARLERDDPRGEADEDEPEDDDGEAMEAREDELLKDVVPKVKTGPKKLMARPATKAKKAPSPAQLKAREAFAARSRARAAAKTGKPVQTEAEIKAKQNADRRKANEAAAEATNPKAKKTGKPVVVKKALTGNALKAHQAKLLRASAAETKAKAPAKKAATRAPREAGATKTKVLDLWAKGLSRRAIAEKLDLSYASVFFHTKGEAAEGGNIGARGKVFVDDPLHKGRGKAEQVSRSEAMRRCYQNLEMSIGDVARKYDVRYQIAYTAIRPLLLSDEDE